MGCVNTKSDPSEKKKKNPCEVLIQNWGALLAGGASYWPRDPGLVSNRETAIVVGDRVDHDVTSAMAAAARVYVQRKLHVVAHIKTPRPICGDWGWETTADCQLWGEKLPAVGGCVCVGEGGGGGRMHVRLLILTVTCINPLTPPV